MARFALVALSAAHAFDESQCFTGVKVSGTAKLEFPADQAHLRVGVTTQNTTQSDAMAANAEAMKDVTDALASEGLSKEEWKTGNFYTNPVWSHRPENATDDWQSKIVGYRVSNSLEIKTQQLNKTGDFIQAATDAGATSASVDQFDLANPEKYRDQAIKAAYARAESDANAIASASGNAIGNVHSVDVDPSYNVGVSPTPMMMDSAASRSAMAPAPAPAPQMNPGKVQVEATVSVQFQFSDLKDSDDKDSKSAKLRRA